MKKMTKKEYLMMLAEVVANSNVEMKEELTQFIDKEVGLIDAKAAKAKEKRAETDEVAEALYKGLVELGAAKTVTDIMAEVDAVAGLSNQKVTAMLTKLKNAGRVIKVTEKKKSYYSAI